MRNRRSVLTLAIPVPAALAVCALLASAAPGEGRKFALIVAVQDYNSNDLPDLKYADNDGNELAALLRQQGYRRVVLMTRSEALKQDRDELDPKADAIRDQFKSVLEDCREGDTVMVAFSGHGVTLSSDGKFYFCPRKANLGDPRTLVSLDEVYAQLKGCQASVKLLVADACRSAASLSEAAGDPRVKTVTLPVLEKPEGGAMAIFSCSAGQKSFESDKLHHGIFTYYVLEGLRGKAADPKTGKVDVTDLWKYVRDEVPVTVKDEPEHHGARQNPHFLGDLTSEAVLARIDAGSGPPDTSTTESAEKTEEFEYTAEGQTKTGARRVRTLDLGGGVTMELVRIKAGTFQMGSPDSDKGASGDEKPPHEVTITKEFYLGKYLVTQQQYKLLMGENPSYFSASGDGKDKVAGLDTKRFPVETVSWDDAQAFCQKLSDKTSRKAGLPTEAQWEYACRAGRTTRFPSGDELTAADANFDYKLGRTSAVGSYPANAFGLCDMTGNVLEWCSDYYDPKYYTNSSKEDPVNIEKSDAGVVRGGSFYDEPRYCRAAFRSGRAPARRYDVGFRVRVRLE